MTPSELRPAMGTKRPLSRDVRADGTIPATEAFRVGKYGPKLDPKGAHVLWDGRLFEVTGAHYREFPSGAFMLDLRTFNREHTIAAPIAACRVLLRDYPEDSEI